MNRFFRTAYTTSFVYLFLALLAALITGVGMPLPAFLCLYLGLLLFILPYAMPRLNGKEALFGLLGVLLALLGFVPILLYRCGIVHYIAYGLGLLAAAIFTNTLKHRTTHDDFSAKFRFSAILILAFIIGLYFLQIIRLTEETALPVETERIKQALDNVVPVAIIMLVSGVLLLRGLRGLQGSADERAFNRRQLRDVLIYSAAVSGVFFAKPLITKGMVWLVNDVVRPFLRWIAWAFNRFLELIANKHPNFDSPKPEMTPEPDEPLMPLPSQMVTELDPEGYKLDEAAETNLYKTLVYVLLAMIAAALIVILIIEIRKLVKKLRGRGASRGRGYPNEIREALTDEETERTEEKPRKRSADPRIRIRYYYREFMRHMRRILVYIHPSDTCGEIRERSKPVLHIDGEELAEFSGIYEHARYSSVNTPTEQEAERMKTIFERIKKNR